MPSALTKEVVSNIVLLHRDGLSNRKIAIKLNINHKTVGSYLKRNNLTPNGTTSQSPNFIDNETIRCSKCLEDKYIEEFTIQRRGKSDEYRLSYCNCCKSKQVLNNLNSDKFKILKDIMLRAGQRCRKNDIEFNLSFEYIQSIFEKQDGKCFYSDTEFVMLRGIGYNPMCCTIDRVVHDKGYIKGNVVLCTKRFNTVKSDMTLLEMKKYTPIFYSKIIKSDFICLEGDF